MRRATKFGIDPHNAISINGLQWNNIETKPLQWASFELQSGYYENYPTNAVYFLTIDDRRFVAYVIPHGTSHHAYLDEEMVGTMGAGMLQIYTASIEVGNAAFTALMRDSAQNSIYREKLLHVSSIGPGHPGQTIRTVDRDRVDLEKIILPPEIVEVLQHSVSTRLQHHEMLERHGHTSKTGVLLHGPPGTGKTLMSKYLVGAWDKFTAIAPMGMQVETLREAFRLASYLQPSLIVIEDVDLLAERRETNANVTGLQELMNEMDGLAMTAETIVIMTTNRPEILEPALASRPGRVSQAIHFPLPDDSLRERLFKLYCGEASVADVNLAKWVERTNGSSPAFLEELCKRALIFAAERTGDAASLSLAQEDFDCAIYELVVFGGQLTAGILGFPSRADDGSEMDGIL